MLLRKSSIQLNDNDTSFIKKNAFNALVSQMKMKIKMMVANSLR